MRKSILEGIAGIGLLAVLPACGIQKQATNEEVYATAYSIPAEPEQKGATKNLPGSVTRSIVVPQVQVDAQALYNRMITYITPEEELTPVVSVKQLSAYIDFPASGIHINPKYGNNRAELVKLEESLSPLLLAGKIKSIRITGYASPDGDTKANERLAGNRAIQFKNYLQKQVKLSDPSLITIDWVGEDWEGLQRLISASKKPYSSRVEAVFQTTNDADSRRKQIKAMDKGDVYKDIEKSFFSRLRRMELTVEMESSVETAHHPLQIEQIYTQPDKLSLTDMLRIAALYRPGTEQYREIYEIAAYIYPSSAVAQLNAAAAALALGDKESARYFFQQLNDDRRAYNNLGVLSLMDGDAEAAATYFRKYMPQNPRLIRENLKFIEGMNN